MHQTLDAALVSNEADCSGTTTYVESCQDTAGRVEKNFNLAMKLLYTEGSGKDKLEKELKCTLRNDKNALVANCCSTPSQENTKKKDSQQKRAQDTRTLLEPLHPSFW